MVIIEKLVYTFALIGGFLGAIALITIGIDNRRIEKAGDIIMGLSITCLSLSFLLIIIRLLIIIWRK